MSSHYSTVNIFCKIGSNFNFVKHKNLKKLLIFEVFEKSSAVVVDVVVIVVDVKSRTNLMIVNKNGRCRFPESWLSRNKNPFFEEGKNFKTFCSNFFSFQLKTRRRKIYVFRVKCET